MKVLERREARDSPVRLDGEGDGAGVLVERYAMARLAPLLPNKPRGVLRVDDRRVISGIIVALRSGGRWIDVPAEYGPRKTLYNRFVRWSATGVWQELFQVLATAGGLPA